MNYFSGGKGTGVGLGIREGLEESLATEEIEHILTFHINRQRQALSTLLSLCGSRHEGDGKDRSSEHPVRKTKTKHNDKSRVDLSTYIRTELIAIDDKEFLIDQHNLLFDTTETHTLVGMKTQQNTYTWFSTGDET